MNDNNNQEQGKKSTLKGRFKSMSTVAQVGITMSVLNGFVMGLVFSQLHMPSHLPIVPRIFSGLISGFVSIFLSLLVSVLLSKFNLTPKTLSDKIAAKFHVDSVSKPFAYLVIQSLVMSVIMTFFIGGTFVLVMSKFNIMAFLMGFLLKDFWRDMVIGWALGLILHKPFAKIVKLVTGFGFL